MLKGPYIVCVGILISVFRFHIGQAVSPEVVTYIMAIINVIALNYVCLDIINAVYKEVATKLEKSALSSSQRKNSVRNTKIIVNSVGWLLFGVLSLFYVCKLCDSTWNDILSIMALVISISAEEIINFLGEKIYNVI